MTSTVEYGRFEGERDWLAPVVPIGPRKATATERAVEVVLPSAWGATG